MKHLLILLICLVSIQQVNAQSLSLFDVDASNFPVMMAKFYAFDAAGKQQRPSASELTLTENGIPRTITSVTCPDVPPKSLSVCIMVDTYKYIDLARTGTERLVNFLIPDKDEIGITIMKDGVQIHRDFTDDLIKAAASAKTIPGAPGVDIQKMFYYPYAGGVPFITNRKADKKILILVSDLHCPNLNLDTAQLYSDAAKQNISVYSVLLGTSDYSGLFKKVAARTGGKVFEGVKTDIEITNIFQEIERREHNDPCTITWQSNVSCLAEVFALLSWNSQTSSEKYFLEKSNIAALEFKPPFVVFGEIPPTIVRDTTITLTARNIDFNITDIRLKFGSSSFSILNTSFPFIIKKDSSKSITFRFSPSDSSYNYATFEITSNICPTYYSMVGGFIHKKMKQPTLKLTKPNGGETFEVGSDTTITWDGIAPSDTVVLDFSYDNGQSWNNITKKASGLQYIWKSIIPPASTKCLIRIRQLNASNIDSHITLTGHTDDITDWEFSPDGNLVATASYDSTVKIWDSYTGTLLHNIKHLDQVVTVRFSPDGSQLLTITANYRNSYTYSTDIWNTATGNLLYKLSNSYGGGVVAYSPNGKLIGRISGSRSLTVWNADNGTFIRDICPINVFNNFHYVHFSPDGTKIATRDSDSTLKIWDTSGVLIYDFKHDGSVAGIMTFSPDGSKFAVSGGINYTYFTKIWDLRTGNLLHTLKKDNYDNNSERPTTILFTADAKQIITKEGIFIRRWDIATGLLQEELDIQEIGNKYCFNSDAALFARQSSAGIPELEILDSKNASLLFNFKESGGSIISLSFDNTSSRIGASLYTTNIVSIWHLGQPSIQEDTSDAVFTTIAPEPQLKNISIDLGKVLVGEEKDSTVTAVICNQGVARLHVLGIDITSGDTNDFIIPRGAGDFFLDSNECRDVMFEFMPSKVGNRSAKATIRTTIGDFKDTITITGQGIAPSLAVVNEFIDFGKTLVGTPKDSIQVVTIKNVGTSNLTITNTDYEATTPTDFSTLQGNSTFTLKPDSAARMDLRFKPSDVGRTSGLLHFHFNGIGSPATVQLFGEGVVPEKTRATVSIPDIKTQAGDRVFLTLKLEKPSGLQIAGAPTEWYARIHYNKTILFNEQTSNSCLSGTDDSCVIELNGTYDPKSNDLISIPCIATLGNTDNSSLVINEFRWTNGSIVPETETRNGTITINGICEQGGVRLFIPAKNATSLSTRPNPAQNSIQIQYGLREPLTITLELLDITGQVVQTIVSNQQQTSGQYTLMNDMSLLGNGVYSLRLTTNKDVLTTRVDIIK